MKRLLILAALVGVPTWAQVPTKNKFIGVVALDGGLMCSDAATGGTAWRFAPCDIDTGTCNPFTSGKLFSFQGDPDGNGTFNELTYQQFNNHWIVAAAGSLEVNAQYSNVTTTTHASGSDNYGITVNQTITSAAAPTSSTRTGGLEIIAGTDTTGTIDQDVDTIDGIFAQGSCNTLISGGGSQPNWINGARLSAAGTAACVNDASTSVSEYAGIRAYVTMGAIRGNGAIGQGVWAGPETGSGPTTAFSKWYGTYSRWLYPDLGGTYVPTTENLAIFSDGSLAIKSLSSSAATTAAQTSRLYWYNRYFASSNGPCGGSGNTYISFEPPELISTIGDEDADGTYTCTGSEINHRYIMPDSLATTYTTNYALMLAKAPVLSGGIMTGHLRWTDIGAAGGGVTGIAADTGGTTTGATVTLTGTGVDTVRSGDTISINVDTTEIGDSTWGNNLDSAIVWNYDVSGTDTAVTYGSGVVNVSTGTLQQGGVDVVTTSGTQTLTNKTIDAGTATTTHAAGANFIGSLRHATDCTAITDGVNGELCYEQDSDRLFVCEPTAGGCDTAAEWRATGGSGTVGGSGTTDFIPEWATSSTLTDSTIRDTAGGLMPSTDGLRALGAPDIRWNAAYATFFAPGNGGDTCENLLLKTDNAAAADLTRLSIPCNALNVVPGWQNISGMTFNSADLSQIGTLDNDLYTSPTAAAGPAFRFSSLNTINATADLFQIRNVTTDRFEIKGSGAIESVNTLAEGASLTAFQFTPTINSTALTNIYSAFTIAPQQTGTATGTGAWFGIYPQTVGLNGTYATVLGFYSETYFENNMNITTLAGAQVLMGLGSTSGAGSTYTTTYGNFLNFDASPNSAALTITNMYGTKMHNSGMNGPGTEAIANVYGYFMDDFTDTGSSNIHGFALAHDSNFLNGEWLYWSPALTTAVGSRTVGLNGTTDGTSATLTADGAFVIDSCANTASAATVTVNSCNKVTLTGSTNVDTINTCNAVNNGRELDVLCGAYTGTLNDATGNLQISGNFVCATDRAIKLVCDATNWQELSRNTFTFPSLLTIVAAGCDGSTASASLDLPVSSAPTKTCFGAAPRSYAYLDFADGAALTAEGHFRLPSDWTGAIDLDLVWACSAATCSRIPSPRWP